MPRPRNATTPALLLGLALLTVCASRPAVAHEGPLPLSLKGIPVPAVPGLLDGAEPIVINKQKAIALGKALFWDSNVGSDGMACASCHYHAGADVRPRNQLAPGGNNGDLASATFEAGADGTARVPNYLLKRRDFPFNQATNPLGETAVYGFLRNSDDVVGSAGTFGGSFRGVELLTDPDDGCARQSDPVFHVNSVGTRRVTQRNAPTVINAVFNHRNFWDGRANNIFNGSSPWGERDAAAGVWIKHADGSVTRQPLHLKNSSLASQALTPPTNATEMSCSGRRLADVGRKLMWRRPLENQKVDKQDSVLGPYSLSDLNTQRAGLNTYYVTLVRQAFDARYWSSPLRGPFGAPQSANPLDRPLPYNQFEANFGMFFALALQLYESTLVSDDSPFDRSQRDAAGVPIDLSASQIRGMDQFRAAHCNQCHVGPTFSTAAVDAIASLYRDNPQVFADPSYPFSTTGSVVIRSATAKGSAMIDVGFAATGVAADAWDVGLAGKDDFGNPLSFVPQYFNFLAGRTTQVRDPEVADIRACDLGVPLALNIAAPNNLWFTQADGVQPQPQAATGCSIPSRAFVPTAAAAAAELAKPSSRKLLAATDSAFKIPTLRNVELTGPYMHNGSMATLSEVIEFYTRGGNFPAQSKSVAFVFAQADLATNADSREDLLNFLKSLTDERVRFERAPFDHPELRIIDGHIDDAAGIVAGHPLDASLARDNIVVIPAVGAAGRTQPLTTFDAGLAP